MPCVLNPFRENPLARPIAWWVIAAVWLNAGGWLLSLAGRLNAGGYALWLGAGALAGAWLWRHAVAGGRSRGARRLWTRWRWRVRHVLPAGFALIALLAILGGALHAPNNFDALQYRTPRVLHWLAAGHWHWIDAELPRLNTRACGFEWLTAPFLALTGSDRWLFLLNAVSFLLLPGLAFSALSRLGVARRVAWHWMWLLPSAYCFALQAGSISNDASAAVLALAAVDFALRARRPAAPGNLWLSLLAAGLMTSAKASNLPLLLPWLLAVAPAWRVAWRRPLATAAVGALAALVSLAPTALLNIRYCGDWTGSNLESANLGRASLTKVAGNALNITLQNLAPPVFPWAGRWNERAIERFPAAFKESLAANFEPGGARLRLSDLQTEEAAGLGFGVGWLLIVSVIAGWALARRDASRIPKPSWVSWSAHVSLLAYMLKVGLTTSARLITPYYALLLPVWLARRGQARLTRARWWRGLAAATMALCAVLLVVNPARPLGPWPRLFAQARQAMPENNLVARAAAVYAVYAARADALAPARALLPADASEVGLIGWGDLPEGSLWRPFGSRRIHQLAPTITGAQARAAGLRYVVIGGARPELPDGTLLADWTREWRELAGARVIGAAQIQTLAAGAAAPWVVLALD